MPNDFPGDRTGRRLLRCDQCGWTQTATSADLARYADDRRPTCCGQAMTVYAEAARPPGPAGPPTR
jgi:hypothetical protein